MNKSVMKCCICNNKNIGRFITINNKKYHLCCIEQLQQENQELKKQLEDTNEELELVRCDLHNRTSEKDGYYRNIEMLENQQKEFIEYLENCINELKKESMNKLQNTINLGIVDITKEILSKYKKIIGE